MNLYAAANVIISNEKQKLNLKKFVLWKKIVIATK